MHALTFTCGIILLIHIPRKVLNIEIWNVLNHSALTIHIS